ncbi:salicylate synthase [Parafrankia colletiae]|uniref:Phenyloxazoline synthase MbtB n=1 Tax=Parafrankia colletiae TaxID=573497 RepID=A0A1S1R2I3_9ACTN|nr:salicylate synthase [Parafrankia colletiae]MCK9900693.1 salicylate synthase [Frankia sp. Cpl3]OHV38944.1 salicylate synthase [Parafrankia colletiae]
MSSPSNSHRRTVPLAQPPATVAARLARGASGPFVVYERAGEWSFGVGVLAEIELRAGELRHRTGTGPWHVEPPGPAPLGRVADILAGLGLTDWRAYGWAAFELSHLLAGLAVPAGPDPLLHLVIPRREVRLTDGVAVVRSPDADDPRDRSNRGQAGEAESSDLADLADLDDLDDLVGVVTSAAPPAATGPLLTVDLEHGIDAYQRSVAAAVADIRADRLRKVILSRVVPVDGDVDLVATYEAGRAGNTPARSFLLDTGYLRAAGFSPETVVEVTADGLVSTQPLAGTRALTGERATDGELREELRSDPKEIYEHAVSVQACQDELSRFCRPGSVTVDEFMTVLERGSVQHLASRVAGRLAAGRDAWDAFGTVFPSITASGVPKVAACAAIPGYETGPRGLYSGAVLMVGADGSLDAALVLRTVFQRDGRTWLRAGAGIVAQSDPVRETEETREKLRSVSRFLVAAPAPVASAPAPAPAGVSAAAAAGPVPGSDIEAIRATVAELLDEEPAAIGDEENLFELGLESIALMKAVGRWRRAGVPVSFGELAENPTVDGWFKILSIRAPEAAPAGAPARHGDTTGRRGGGRGDEATPAGPGLTAGTAAESDAGPALDTAGKPGAPPTAGPATEAAPGAGGEFPLALMQHAYWVGRDGGQPLGQVAAHLFTEFDGDGVDPERLRLAVEKLIARHDMLRMRVTDNGAQVIEETSGWRGLTVHDLRDLDEAAAQARLAEIRDLMSHEMLDIEAGEVFATALSLLPGNRSRLHLDVDMVAADAVSYRVLLADLAHFYDRPAEELPPPGYTYREYRAARGPDRTAAARAAAEWWQGRLPSLPGPPGLPRASATTDLTAAAGPAGAAGADGRAQGCPTVSRRYFVLLPSTREALRRAAHSRGVTPAMAVATAFAEVLAGWSTESRFVLNVPMFDREPVHADINQVVGDFTSSVLLEVDLTEQLPFAARVRQVQARLHADAAHAEYSGVEVLRDLTRRTGEQVLAPVVFTSALGLGELFDTGVRRHFGDPVWIISQGPQVLLDAQVTELDGGLLVNWDVREDEFPAGVVDAMFGAFERLVRDLADAAGAWDAAVDDLLPGTARDVRRAVNDTAGPSSSRLLHEAFFEWAGHTPDAPALLWDGEHGPAALTYGQLRTRALALAGALARHGVHRGDLVGISLPKGPSQVAAVLGVLAAGGTYVPVGVEQPPARVERIATAAGFTVLITTAPRDGVPAGIVQIAPDQATTDEATDPAAGPPADQATDPAAGPAPEPDVQAPTELGGLDRPAYVLFTSGSTGQPKGVEVGHRAAVNTIDDLVERLGLGAGDRTLAVSALDFDLSVFDLFAPLSVGGAVVLVDEQSRREARRWAELVRDHRVTILNCVPTVLDLVLSAGVELGGSLRAVLLGGDRVGVDLPGRLVAAVPGARFLGLGGTTETAIHSTVCEVAGTGPVPGWWRSVPYGTPLRNVRLRVVDPLGRDCPDHVAGELWIGGDGVARGYLGDPERTADRFVEHAGLRWYRTGDLARYQPDGTVEFLGRRDHQVKIRGFRIELGEVEAALATLPEVQAGVAVLVDGAGGHPAALGAGIVPAGAPAGTELSAAVREGLRRVLPPHMVPDLVVTFEAMPLTANGKIDRRAVTAAVRRAVGGSGDHTPPRSDLERVVHTVWREVLGITEFGVADEFFALGGDSVLATAVVRRLRDELDTTAVSVRSLFAAPTVATLADRIRAADTVPGRSERVATIALEIAAMTDEEVADELGDVGGPR